MCTTWAIRGESVYLLNVYRDQLDFPTLKRRVIELKDFYGADVVVIEDQASGTGLIQQLESERRVYPIAFRPEGTKADRMSARSAIIESGRVHVPAVADWIDDFRVEMLAFPFGHHDDQVDSVSQFLTWYSDDREPNIGSREI